MVRQHDDTLWAGLETGAIVLGDRFFCSFFGIACLEQRGVDVLFRMRQRREFDFRRGRRLGVLDHVATWTKPARPNWMDEETDARMPAELTVRELRVQVEPPGFRVNDLVLAATMLDAAPDPKADLADLFLQRWNIELDLRSIKAVLQMDVLRCKTPEMVEKEIWMHLLAYNLIRVMTAFQDVLRQATPRERKPLMEALLAAVASHRVGHRFGRVGPRANKRRPQAQRDLMEPRKEARKRLMGNT